MCRDHPEIRARALGRPVFSARHGFSAKTAGRAAGPGLWQIVFGTETDPAARVEELRKQKQAIEDEIAWVQAGEFDVLDASAVLDRYQQFAARHRRAPG
jgi:hypothetical protein